MNVSLLQLQNIQTFFVSCPPYNHVRYKCEKGYYIYNIGVLTVNIESMCRGLETGERRAFSESFHPFRAESHTLYIYCQYPNIVFILQ